MTVADGHAKSHDVLMCVIILERMFKRSRAENNEQNNNDTAQKIIKYIILWKVYYSIKCELLVVGGWRGRET